MKINLIVLFVSIFSFGQNVIKDTIYISKEYNTHLLFGTKIVMANYGSDIISADGDGKPVTQEINKNEVLILKADRKFKNATNITIVTAEDDFYDITVKYAETPKKKFYAYSFNPLIQKQSQQVIKKIPLNKDSEELIEDVKIENGKTKEQYQQFFQDSIYYKKEAQNLYANRSKLTKIKKINIFFSGIELSLTSAYSIRDKLYLIFDIRNSNSFPFNIDAFEFLYSKQDGWNRQTVPESYVKNIYEYNPIYQAVLPNQKMTKVFVFEQIGLHPTRELFVNMLEKNSQKEYILKIPSRYIINPKNNERTYAQGEKDKQKKAQEKIDEEIKKQLNQKK